MIFTYNKKFYDFLIIWYHIDITFDYLNMKKFITILHSTLAYVANIELYIIVIYTIYTTI